MGFPLGDINSLAFIFFWMWGCDGARLSVSSKQTLSCPHSRRQMAAKTHPRVLAETVAAQSPGDTRNALQFSGPDSWDQK